MGRNEEGLDGDGLALVEDGSIVGVEDEDEQEGLDEEAVFDGVAGCLRLIADIYIFDKYGTFGHRNIYFEVTMATFRVRYTL